MPRVLIVNFGAIARRGLLGFLDEAGVEVLAESSDDGIGGRLAETKADVVVLNLDAEGATARAREIAQSFPRVKVIACSAEEPTMLVLRPHGRGSYFADLTSAQLAAEVATADGRR